jgi:hypothetical protein
MEGRGTEIMAAKIIDGVRLAGEMTTHRASDLGRIGLRIIDRMLDSPI